ncbi:MAG: hypothetical protein ACFFA6_04035 [Promethearchaeota archaeon]
MEYKAVIKSIEIMSIYIIILSLMEIATAFLLNFTEFNVLPNSILLQELIFSSKYVNLSGSIFWVFLIISMFFFLILGVHMYRISVKKNIESKPLAKYLVIIGMTLLLGGFVKMDYLVLLGKTKVEISALNSIPFQTALYDSSITPFIAGVFWIFLISVIVCFLITGVIITAAAIKWTADLDRESKSNT